MTDKKKPQPNKQIKVSPNVHYDIKVTAAKEGRDMRELIEEAWELYKEHRNRE